MIAIAPMLAQTTLAQTTQDGVSMEAFGWGTLAFGLAGTIGLVLWIVSVLRRTGRADGTVVRHDAVNNSEGGTTFARVAEFHVDGERYECEDTSSSSWKRGNPGDRVTISYRPSRPDKANFTNGGRTIARLVGWLVLGVTFGGMIALGVLMIAEGSESALG